MRSDAELGHPATEPADAGRDAADDSVASVSESRAPSARQSPCSGSRHAPGRESRLARNFEAEVTAVSNTKNLELVRSLGADEVVDYTREDFTKNGKSYDVVFDAVGRHSFRRCRGSLKPGGIYLETDLGYLWHVPILALLTRWLGDKRVTLPVPKYRKEEVLLLKELIEAGKYRAVIDRRYPLEQVVEATKYVETGQKTGNVVLSVSGDRATPQQLS
jgi:NADPH:quinone reductase-like Zn-dependent oxidoreductase